MPAPGAPRQPSTATRATLRSNPRLGDTSKPRPDARAPAGVRPARAPAGLRVPVSIE
ncbi:hypothetical protein CBM2587_A120045 [Cupriavidus taiwanensis]|uniref:Uncharacterized protein n=1 Tax=Cupriavidus taiwanensis TaxID=164546 RepID=A0A375BHD2_9BURK|nr:hypothetical protein CBM2587_A120045 [Cupriavidus taiwanensis]